MSDANVKHCSDCGGEMETGFYVDMGYGSVFRTRWHPGPPEKSFWFGTKVNKDKMIPVTVLRCRGCGLLKSYAIPGNA
jgi:hypothetical protein